MCVYVCVYARVYHTAMISMCMFMLVVVVAVLPIVIARMQVEGTRQAPDCVCGSVCMSRITSVLCVLSEKKHPCV